MKKQLLIATGLAVLSSSAYATKARMDALGQSLLNNGRGSFYIQDTRGVFLNPARVNQMKDYAVFEWGEAHDQTDLDDPNAAGFTQQGEDPHAEGGFFRSMGNFAYGVYLGSEIDAQNGERATAYENATAPLYHDDAIDLFFAGDAGIQWGIRLHFAYDKDETTGPSNSEKVEAKQFALGLGLGVIMGDLEAYSNLMLTDESEGVAAVTSVKEEGTKFEADLGLNLGVNYKFAGWTWFIDYDKRGYDFTRDADVTGAFAGEKDDFSETTLQFGAGRVLELTSSARIYTDLRYYSNSKDLNEYVTTGAENSGEETKVKIIPLVIGFEADATSWLTLRGSIYHELYGKSERTDKEAAPVDDNNVVVLQGKSARQATTNVFAGATLNFGKLKVDGLIGTGAYDNATAPNPKNTNEGVLKLDNLLTRVAVHYWF